MAIPGNQDIAGPGPPAQAGRRTAPSRATEQRYVFRKPAWRVGVPLLLLAAAWTPALFLSRGRPLLPPAADHPVTAGVEAATAWLSLRGFDLNRFVQIALGASLPLLAWLYTGLERIVATTVDIGRGLPGLPQRRIRWVDLEAVHIDHVGVAFEGEASALRTLTLVARPVLGLWHPAMRVTNRQFEGYSDVERVAVAVGVPAIADRLRRRIEVTGKPVFFAVRSPGHRRITALLALLAVALLAAGLHDPLWRPGAASWRAAATSPFAGNAAGMQALPSPAVTERVVAVFRRLSDIPNPLALPAVSRWRGVAGAAAFPLVLWALFRAFPAAVGIDRERIVVARAGRAPLAIPFDRLADIQVLDNTTRIYGFRGDRDSKPRLVWETDTYIPNRGVMLRLVRDLYTARQNETANPTTGGPDSSSIHGSHDHFGTPNAEIDTRPIPTAGSSVRHPAVPRS